jgi:CheY-like chemotaxis protein
MQTHDPNILVVDDSPTVRRLSELILTQQGYKVYTAEDGEKGLKIAKETLPAAILVDFVMPNMNGHQFCRRLRSDPTLKEIPVILISAKGQSVAQVFEEQFGIIDYFTKPFEPEDLVKKLNEVLSASPKGARDNSETLPSQDILDTFQEKFDKIIRKYFHQEFPLLIKNTFSDSLYETGLVKRESLILSGNLAQVPLPDIINFAYNSRLSGRMTVFSKDIFGEVFIENGHLVFATLSRKGGTQQFLTDLLKNDGRLSCDAKTMADVVEESRTRNISVGQVLVQRELITERELMDCLKLHAQQAFNGILEAMDGNFFLENDSLPLNLKDISFRLPLISVLMEGLRHLDEMQQAAQFFQDEDVVLLHLITNEDALTSFNLSDSEVGVFSLIDGKKPLKQLLQESHMGPREVKRVCYFLSKVGLVRIKDRQGE